MELTDKQYKTRIFWTLQVIGWTIFGIFDSYMKYQDNFDSIKGFIAKLVTYLTGILVTLLLRKIYIITKTSSKPILVMLSFIALYSTPAALFWLFIDSVLSIPIWGWAVLTRGYISLPGLELFSLCFYHTIVLIAWSGLYFGISYTLEWNIQNEKIEKTQLLLELAQLKVLRYQLNPHFLFNALSSLRMLIRKDSKRAEQMLNKIAEFLRYSLTSKNNNEVPLNEELKAIQHYFEIEKIRFEDKLDFTYNIDPLAEDFPIPIFLIHPLVENAIKYGMDTSNDKLRIELNAKVKDQTLTVEVSNSGAWIEPDKNKNGIGMGLKNVRKRLDYAFPNNNSFRINIQNGKVKVSLTASRRIGKE